MKPWERWTFGVLALVVAATGVAYLWMKYLVVNDDPFAVVNHPWQAPMLAAHVLAAPALLLTFGIILNSHILRKLRAADVPNRKSGLASFGSFFAMTASGYLLQVVTSAALLPLLVILHVATGVMFAAVYVVHLMISVRLARRQPAPRLMKTA